MPRLKSAQPDLFAENSPQDGAAGVVSDEVASLVRERLRATVAMMQGAARLPWPDAVAAALAENAFRHDMTALPAAEAEMLWQVFDAEMDRLYAASAAQG